MSDEPDFFGWRDFVRFIDSVDYNRWFVDGKRNIQQPATKSMILQSILAPVTKRHVQKKIIKTHPLHLFRIIQDVDDYVNFLPLCSYSKILKKEPDGRSFDGKLIVGKPPLFSEEYTSRVTVTPETLTIQMKSIESQRIDSLRSQWSLEEMQRKNDEVHCGVTFELE